MTNYELVPIGYQIHFTYPIALTFYQIMVFSYNCLVQYDRITFEQGKVFEIEMNLGKYFSLYTIRSIFPHDEYCKLMINIPTVSNGNIVYMIAESSFHFFSFNKKNKLPVILNHISKTPGLQVISLKLLIIKEHYCL